MATGAGGLSAVSIATAHPALKAWLGPSHIDGRSHIQGVKMRIAVRLAVAFAVALLSGRQVQAVESKEGCMLPVALPAAVANARLVFLGEYHGTREAPLFAAEVACTMAQK